jgi:hypothetical protein
MQRGAHIGRHDFARCHPRLRGLPVPIRYQSRDGSHGSFEAEFQQSAVDAWRSPQRIGDCSCPNQARN